MRLRTGRWKVLLGVWFAVLAGLTLLLRLAVTSTSAGVSVPAGGPLDGQQPGLQYLSSSPAPPGTAMYGGLMLLVLGLGLLVVPALSAQSVNGDRDRGVLATLQVTRLSAAEIALGKLVAAWGTALVFLAVTAPLVVWAMVEGGVPVAQVLASTLVVGLLLGVVAAVALGLSALLARTTTSAVLSYLTVAALTVGTLVVFGLATAATQQRVTRTFQAPAPSYSGAPALPTPFLPGPPAPGLAPPVTTTQTYTETVTRTDRVWWLLAPNPFVVLADAAPAAAPRRLRLPDGQVVDLPQPLDPLSTLGTTVRRLRVPPAQARNEVGLTADPSARQPSPPPVWPWGLAADVGLGAAAVLVAVRRLRAPSRRLPRGARVA